MPSILKMLLLSTALTLTGCSDGTQLFSSSPSSGAPQQGAGGASGGYYKVGTPYQVSGVWYYPKEDFGYKEIGVASWYGPDFHNGITANGELYDMHGLTAAHRTLPLPSIVRVTNLQNGRSLVLRVNDRGPFVNNRIIDVSMRAAQLLGFKDTGTTQVQVEILPEESKALRDELQAGAPTGAREQIDVSISQEAASLENIPVQGIRPAPPKDLSASPDYPRLANPRPGLSTTDAPLIASAAAAPSSSYNDWDEDLSKAQAEKTYTPPAPAPKKAAAPKKAPAKPAAKPAEPKVSANIVPMTDVAPGYYVQVGAFGSIENANKMRERIARFGAVVTTPVSVNGKTLYRVRLGPSNAKKALETMDRVTSAGFSGARLVEEKGTSAAGRRLDNEF